ncbi:LysR family transcriptional regulator [Paracoccus sp. Z330]|uniref:LysR family transcriptional regulator n=1 Tax=Paracoccus onchidii TaxID=3017813 RepID=A0ABT4ZHV0_9RHOB|nr:LysR family transcriptional regulator [Paracoccus onchidii]MDB6178893.1 LysR family transcriptional regulator [Paracoccus onchidii]
MNPPRIKLRLQYAPTLVLGPGKAELLEAISRTGSISAAGREMGMSYRRAWALVEEMNAGFSTPVVDSSRGGPGGGGAVLTPTGHKVLHHFRQLEDILRDHGAQDIEAISKLLK